MYKSLLTATAVFVIAALTDKVDSVKTSQMEAEFTIEFDYKCDD